MDTTKKQFSRSRAALAGYFPTRVTNGINMKNTNGMIITVCTVALLMTTHPGWTQDWPQWRGVNRDGCSTETGLLKTWPEGGPKLLWTAKGLGGGYSGLSFSGGRIFGMSYRGADEVVWALDLKAGKELWSTRIAPADEKIGYPEGSRCTPTVADGRLFVLGAGGMLASLEAETGKLVWQKDLVKEFGGKMMSGWGYSESPLVDGNQVLCTPGGPGGTVLALNKQNGEPLWQTKDLTDKAAYSSLVIATLGGVRQYVVLTDASVAGIAAEGGKVLWHAPRPGRTAVIPTPIVRDDLVFVTSGYGVGCNAFRITSAGGAFKAEEVYANKVMVNHHGGVVLVGDHLYGYSEGKGWACQMFKTGESVWEEKGKLGKGSITYADGHLYLRFEGNKGTMALIEATPAGYRETGRFEQPERSDKNSWPHPVILDGRLYLRDQDILLCYDIRQR